MGRNSRSRGMQLAFIKEEGWEKESLVTEPASLAECAETGPGDRIDYESVHLARPRPLRRLSSHNCPRSLFKTGEFAKEPNLHTQYLGIASTEKEHYIPNSPEEVKSDGSALSCSSFIPNFILNLDRPSIKNSRSDDKMVVSIEQEDNVRRRAMAVQNNSNNNNHTNGHASMPVHGSNTSYTNGHNTMSVHGSSTAHSNGQTTMPTSHRAPHPSSHNNFNFHNPANLQQQQQQQQQQHNVAQSQQVGVQPSVPLLNVPSMPAYIRPVDRLHALINDFHGELDVLLAALRDHPTFSDAAVNAWKEDTLNRLMVEVVPALGVATQKVANVVRDGMVDNRGGIRVFTGGI